MTSRLKVIPDDNAPKKPWYQKGLNFKCTECGQCCTGAPGFIWITQEEITNIAEFLKISIVEFVEKYVRQIGDRFSLNEDYANFDCTFLKNKKCSIYSVRPKQCRTFPWWPKNLQSEEAWEEAASFCEGISKQQPLVPLNIIQEQLHIQNKS